MLYVSNYKKVAVISEYFPGVENPVWVQGLLHGQQCIQVELAIISQIPAAVLWENALFANGGTLGQLELEELVPDLRYHRP